MKKQKMNKGITLIALIITIVVLLILAAVAIAAIKGDGIISHAKNAKAQYSKAQDNELIMLQNYENQLNKEITAGGKKVTLTKENIADYLGKVVTNYTGATSVTIDSNTYTVSPIYRLYYVDFDNKYGDGAGTIYLKADCTSNNYSLPTTDTTAATESNIKIKNLNPELYKEGVTPPSATNGNMKAVTWLTNTNNWATLKDTSMSNSINYIVGAPSLEMMIDSYNTHYSLIGEAPQTGTITAGERIKLFYQYQSNFNGYNVGPYYTEEYGMRTSKNSIYTDSSIDSMYFPGDNQRYWLTSPSSFGTDGVMYVASGDGGHIDNSTYGYTFTTDYAICPLVSLESSANLILAE